MIVCGGGCKGISLIGALKCLEKYGILKNIDNFIACSSGNFAILFIILNINICESYTFSRKISNSFINKDNIIHNLIHYNGLFKGKEFIDLIDDFLYKKTNIKYMTLKDLFLKTNKNYTIISTDISNFKIVYFNHKSHPNLLVSEAIKASCSLPILFCPSYFLEVSFCKKTCKKHKAKHNYYCSRTSISYIGIKNKKLILTRDRTILEQLFVFIYFSNKWIMINVSLSSNITINNNICIQKSIPLKKNDNIQFFNKWGLMIKRERLYSDGAVLDNYPIYLSNTFKTPTIGFYFKTSGKKKKNNNDNPLSMLKNIILGISKQLEYNKINHYMDNTVIINIPKKISITDLYLDLNDAKLLTVIGYKATKDFIEKKIINV